MSRGGENLSWRGFVDERRAFLSAWPASPVQRRLALTVVAISAAIFLAAIPFARTPLAKVWAFIPVYQSALAINDLVTAALLYGQFRFVKSWSLLALASGYLFTSLMAAAHGLTFPGLFSDAGLFGAGPQSTAWMYMFWHAGFPLAVIAHALLKEGADRKSRPAPQWRRGFRAALAWSIGLAIAAVCAFTALATAGQSLLPAIMIGNGYTPAMIAVVSSVWAASILALAMLWRRPPHTLLDAWLMVVMCAWVFDIALSAVFNAGRFDLGFYAGRIYGLAAASFVLVVLLIENGVLYGRLAIAHEREFRERQRAQAKAIDLSAANKELEAFSYSVSHDLRAPLRAVIGYARLLEEHGSAQLDEEGRRLLGVVRSSSQRMGQLIDDLLAFSRVGREAPARAGVDTAALVNELVAELARDSPSAQVSVAALPRVFADQALLKQVWSNLIDNALKYSGKRERPQIEIGTRQEPAEEVFWVRDNGVGFDMRYAARLFGVFQRLHRQEEFPGTGVGLAIVQRIVARHGGRVWAEAKPGEGACFFFSLPRRSDEAGNTL